MIHCVCSSDNFLKCYVVAVVMLLNICPLACLSEHVAGVEIFLWLMQLCGLPGPCVFSHMYIT